MERALPLGDAQRFGESTAAPLDWMILTLRLGRMKVCSLFCGMGCMPYFETYEYTKEFIAASAAGLRWELLSPSWCREQFTHSSCSENSGKSLYVSHISDFSVGARVSPALRVRSSRFKRICFLLDRQLFVPGDLRTLQSPGLLSTRTEAPASG